MHKLGIDYGDARIGLAISDPLGMFATGLETYKTVIIEKVKTQFKKIKAK